MNYSKFFLLLSLFFCTSVVAITPDELLMHLKALAADARLQRMERCKRNYETTIDKTQYPRTVAQYKEEYESWQRHIKLDHIRLTFYDNGRYTTEYIQLEKSRAYPRFGFSRIYPLDQKHNDQVLKRLSEFFPEGVQPKVEVYISKKRRLEKRFLCFNKEIDDLYAVSIDYTHRLISPEKIVYKEKPEIK